MDVILGLLPFEEKAIQRARSVEIGGEKVRFATAEDLILLKIVSRRDRDRADIRGVVRMQAEHLDLVYLEPRIEELSTLLDSPEITEFWTAVKSSSKVPAD